jgi:formate dehydrogenase subunit gamma
MSAVVRAREEENVLVGSELLRHRYSSRLIHWAVAVAFLLCLVSGLPIWTPIFGWVAPLVGGLYVCRWLHPWTGAAFALSSLIMFLRWVKEMRLEPQDRGWLGPKMIEYLKFQGGEDPEVGKYNGGQKLFFFAEALAALGLLASGIVLWFPHEFTARVREIALVIHDVTFVLATIGIVAHVYLGTAAEPGTFRAMVVGTVTKDWAKLHHPRWYREVTGEGRKQG